MTHPVTLTLIKNAIQVIPEWSGLPLQPQFISTGHLVRGQPAISNYTLPNTWKLSRPFKNIRAENEHSSLTPSYSRHEPRDPEQNGDSPTPAEVRAAESELSFLIHSPKLSLYTQALHLEIKSLN